MLPDVVATRYPGIHFPINIHILTKGPAFHPIFGQMYTDRQFSVTPRKQVFPGGANKKVLKTNITLHSAAVDQEGYRSGGKNALNVSHT